MRRCRLIPAVLLVVVAGCSDERGGGRTPSPADVADAVVRRVVDGDTLIARIDGVDVRVRMLGVDAPESVTPDRPVECFGPEASARAHALLPEGTRIILATDPTQWLANLSRRADVLGFTRRRRQDRRSARAPRHRGRRFAQSKGVIFLHRR